MTDTELREQEALSLSAREHIIKMSTNGGCFTGASLSCVDLLTYLYCRFLNISPTIVTDPDRDYLFLSKGHDVPALYAVLAELGFIDRARLSAHLSTSDSIYWHPNRDIPGVEFHSGSLGHLLSVAMGVSLDIQQSGGTNRVVVVLGDGELNEGSVWEGLMIASTYKLNNLIIVIDRNKFQANVRTNELTNLEPLPSKFEAFGCTVANVDAHDFIQLDEYFREWTPNADGKPTVVIAHSIRGKGLPSIEERADRWFCNFSEAEVNNLILELHGHTSTELSSSPLHIR